MPKKEREVDISDVVGKKPGPGEILPSEALGDDDLGDGFRVRSEPVLIDRDEDGDIKAIRRFDGANKEEAIDKIGRGLELKEKYVAPPVSVNRPLTAHERDALVGDLADRIFLWYERNLSDASMLNPIRDGIPVCPRHDPCVEQCSDASRKYASLGEVQQFFRRFVAKRARIVNKKNEWKGWSPTLTITRK